MGDDDRGRSEAIFNAGLRGREITGLRLSYATTLEFADAGFYAAITLESPFLLRSGPETIDGVDPADPSTLAPVLAVLRRTLIRASISSDSTLSLIISGGLSIEAPKSPAFESWSMVGNHHDRVVCMPGGGLAYWTGDR